MTNRIQNQVMKSLAKEGLTDARAGDMTLEKHERDQGELVMRLFVQHQRWLFGYLMTLLGNATDVEDVVQEVSVIVWKEHHNFRPDSSFVSWLGTIAYHQVQKVWRQRKKQTLFSNPELLEQLAEDMVQEADLMTQRRDALSKCIGRLRESDRSLIGHCYGDQKVSMKSVAEKLGRPVDSVYKAANRIRKSLFECINLRLANETGVTDFNAGRE